MKERQELILKLITEQAITTQEELLSLLKNRGMDVTQATVSRDIRALNITKTPDGSGGYRYCSIGAENNDTYDKYRSIFKNAVIKIDNAMNDVVIKCYAGTAGAACAALDGMPLPEIIGTLAGDDTIFIITKDETAAENLVGKLLEFM